MPNLREALESAFAEAESKEAEVVVSEPVETPEPEPAVHEKPRDEKGKFAKVERSEPEVKDDQAELKQELQPEAKLEVPVNPAPERRVPTTWRKEAAAKWAEIPDDIKDEILKRENDARSGIQAYKSDADMARAFREVSKPFERTLQELNVSPVQAYQYLMAADARLRYSAPQEKARYFSELARAYGIDLTQVQPLPAHPPEYQHLQQEVRTLRQQQEQWMKQQNESLLNEIQSFAESHEHLEAVRPAMAVLLQNGQAKDLQDAYDKATWADPEIRALLLQKQQSEASKRVESQALAQRQKAAAVSVKGSTPASGSGSGPKGSLRAELEAAWGDMNG